MADNTSVRVSVRIRPLLGKEKLERCSECVKPISHTELVMMGKDKMFTFDNVFGKESHQHEIYDKTVSALVESLFDGYNATVLAYGQTGSGKTYTMGTATDCIVDNDETKLGVIPRAMTHIFDIIEQKKEADPRCEFYLRVQFLEVYGEIIRDLLDPAEQDKKVEVREMDNGVQVVGAKEESVKSTQEMLNALERGALCRTTGSTEMNLHSSRSHAIFTVIVEQHLPISSSSTDATENDAGASGKQQTGGESEGKGGEDDEEENQTEIVGEDPGVEYRTAKFHFVDLAGSERAKRTGATGTRMKEGININKGLLCLGNVICALSDPAKAGGHVPYRDSKLTRMLQDSLGGNSRTLMIACVSPADANFEETLNALRYANRAKNIKNKPIVNRDPNSSQIAHLKNQIAMLKMQLYGNKGGPLSGMTPNGGFGGAGAGFFSMEDPTLELRQDLEKVRMRAETAENEILKLTDKLEREKRERSELQEKYITCVAQLDYYSNNPAAGGDGNPPDPEAIKSNANYLRKIEQLQQQLKESDNELAEARKDLQSARSQSLYGDSLDEIEKEIVRNARLRKSLGMPLVDMTNDLDSDNILMDDLTTGNNNDEENNNANDDDIDDIANVDDEEDPSLLEVTEDDDEVTRKLKEKFHQTHEGFKKMYQRCDVELRNKQLLMQQMVEERKRHEALKAHYESKLAEMNHEVAVTQQERDSLDGKIKQLEQKESSKQVNAQIERLKAELRAKIERLRVLEKQSRDLVEAKRAAMRAQQKEKQIMNEIENIKRQKVEAQRRMAEAAKKFREDEKERRLEIGRLRKEKQVASQNAQKAQARSARDGKLLKHKTEQLTSLQRKLREAQRLTAHNKKLTEKERKQRLQLEQWTKDRIKREEEIQKLQHSLAKQQAAIARKEQICRKLEQCRKAAEERARKAEAMAQGKMKKQSLRSFFVGSGGGNNDDENTDDEDQSNNGTPSRAVQLTPEELQAIEELEQRLEDTECEITFHQKQSEAAAANIDDDDAPGTSSSTASASSALTSSGGKASSSSKRKGPGFPIEMNTLEDAQAACQQLLRMYLESKKSSEDLEKQVEEFKVKEEEENRSKREMNRRKSLLPMGSPSIGGVGPSGKIGHRHSLDSPLPSRPLVSSHDMTGTEEILRLEIDRLINLLQSNGIDPGTSYSVAKLQALEDCVRDLAVSTQKAGAESSRRSSLSNGFNIYASPTPRSSTGGGGLSPVNFPLNSPDFSSSAGSHFFRQYETRNVFERLTNTQNYTGIHKQKVNETQQPKQNREEIVDELDFSKQNESDGDGSERLVDELNPATIAELHRKGSAVVTKSPRSSNNNSPITTVTKSPRNSTNTNSSRRSSRGSTPGSPPQYAQATESYSNKKRGEEQQRKRKGSKTQRDSPAFCSTAGPGGSSSKNKNFAASQGGPEGGDAGTPGPGGNVLKTETGTYRAEGSGLYRQNSNSKVNNAKARQQNWENSSKQTQRERSVSGAKRPERTPKGASGSSSDGSPTLAEVSLNNTREQQQNQKATVEPKLEKENSSVGGTGAADDLTVHGVSVHEKLSDPKNYTGTQKAKLMESLRQERLKRKQGKFAAAATPPQPPSVSATSKPMTTPGGSSSS